MGSIIQPYFHEKSYQFMRQKALYGRTGYFLNYSFLCYLQLYLFSIDSGGILHKIKESREGIIMLGLYFAISFVLIFLAFRWGRVLKKEAQTIENEFESVAKFIFLFQKYDQKIKLLFTCNIILIIIIFGWLQDTVGSILFIIIMIIQLWWRSNLTNIDTWNNSLKE